MNKEYERIMRFFRHFAYVNVIYIKHEARHGNVYYEGFRIVVPLNDPALLVGFSVTRENNTPEYFCWKRTAGEVVFEGSARNLSKHLTHLENYTDMWDTTMDYHPALFGTPTKNSQAPKKNNPPRKIKKNLISADKK